MRISDWSSDVCSSDLVFETRRLQIFGTGSSDERNDAGGARHVIERSKVAIIASVIEPEARRRPAQADGHEGDGGPGGDRHKSRADEIGRASGRERVGQYV